MPHGHRTGGTAWCLAAGRGGLFWCLAAGRGGLFMLVLLADPGIHLFSWLGLDTARFRAAADAGKIQIHSCWQLKGGV